MAIGAITPDFFVQSAKGKEFSPSDALLMDSGPGPNEKLWFTYPAKYWNSQALHIGNGFLGLSFLGGVEEEIIGITEKTLWTGGPGENPDYNYGIRPGGKDHLSKIRELIVSNRIDNLKQADNLVKDHFLGDDKGYGHFSAFGRLSILHHHTFQEYKNYIRSLDLSSSIANVQYDVDGTTFKREYFCSYPDRVAVLKFSSTKANSLSINLKWNVFQQQHEISFNNKVYQLSGSVNGNNRKFSLKMHVDAEGGTVTLKGDELVVEKASVLTIVLAAATEYSPIGPSYKGEDPDRIAAEQISAAGSKTVSDLKHRHIKDYRQLYDTVQFHVPDEAGHAKSPTNERWKNYSVNKNVDPGFKVLYFNLSRYLLISSSRPGSLPANLQGGWNMFEAAQWAGNYQSNINVQLNYSGAAAVNLLSCQTPYIEWIKGLVKPGTEVAKAYYNSDGWVSHSIGNIWGYAAPGFEIEWGMYPAGAAWHCHFIWKHFLYSQDLGYLRETGYPVMKGAALFWLQNLVDYKGNLISAPSGSAEHGVFIENGKLFATGSSFDEDIINVPCNFQDIEMIYELFTNTIQAAAYLQTDAVFSASMKQAKDKLMPLKIGQYGQLQEWEDDLDSPVCNHRHIGHLYGLWPGKQITADTVKLAEAAKKTLLMRGEERNYKNIPHKDIHTAANWSLGLRMACWLRLREAEHANKLFTQIITEAGFENLMTYQQVPQSEKAVSSQPDVEFFKTTEGYWCGVWQIDTSLAIAGFIAEMLLQTNEKGQLFLLPALPWEWPNGKIKGLKAEGNLTVDMEWENRRVTSYRIYAAKRVKVSVYVNNVLNEILTTSLLRWS